MPPTTYQRNNNRHWLQSSCYELLGEVGLGPWVETGLDSDRRYFEKQFNREAVDEGHRETPQVSENDASEQFCVDSSGGERENQPSDVAVNEQASAFAG